MCFEPSCPIGWEWTRYEDSCRHAGPLNQLGGRFSLKALRHFFGECYGKPHFYSTKLHCTVHIELDSVAPAFIPCSDSICANREVFAEEYLIIFYRSWWPLSHSWLGLTYPF